MDSKVVRALQASGLAAAIAWFGLRIATARFYGSIGASPEEVGWSLQVGLVRAMLPAAMLVVGVAAATSVAWATRRARSKSGVSQRSVVVAVVVAVLGLATVYSTYETGLRKSQLEAGRSFQSPLLGVSADCVTVQGTGLAAELDGSQVLWLGQHDHTVLLFDQETDSTVRLPAIEILARGGDSEACYDGEVESAISAWLALLVALVVSLSAAIGAHLFAARGTRETSSEGSDQDGTTSPG